MGSFRPILPGLALCTLLLVGCRSEVPTGPYEPTAESLQAHQVPEWFRDAKFGIFVHWGPYSVPAYGDVDGPIRQLSYAEWYWFLQLLFGPESSVGRYHLDNYGQEVVYDDFLRDWSAEQFEPQEWMDLFSRAGARYTVLVTKHHDGVALFPTRTTHRSTARFGPQRDIVREFVGAARGAGLRVGFYYSWLEWFHPDYHGDNGRTHVVDTLPLRYPERVNPYTGEPVEYLGYLPIDDYVDDHVLPQLRELVDRYDPDLLWFDGDWDLPSDYWRSAEAVAYFYNRHRRPEDLVVNSRLGNDGPSAGFQGDYASFEYSLPGGIREEYFEATRGLGDSFGYNQSEPLENYLTAEEVIETLVDVVSKNGNLLLNVGPAASGEIPELQRNVLLGAGAWLDTNGEAIYSTRPWRVHGGDGVRFTTRGRTLYIHLFDQPTLAASVPLPAPVPEDAIRTMLLGCGGATVTIEAGGEALVLDGSNCGSQVWVVALEYDHDL